ncbi:uncharacterized protein A1O9_11823 [Exophiala aquamarina CBS 119918]|uniref:HEAT repeat protein n=1 Tax=Exophiala aquamarina CBS 119918 TaxID=1182545 RepID=A0A072NX85_9EURO|nr:uncharacterized protein A1O9_11823 [Exophiala aquamarina CBS 119918]KEF52196.1 hypothetical protein A1O9_11823 [Exophiala aquamarina CBS 119918]
MNQRQEAFQRLRSPCVELSSVVLKFKTNQAASKAVLLALEPVFQALDSLGQQDSLDQKLAEYAFFPLTQILNQSRQLPSQVLELTLKCTQILISKGWKENLTPQMGKQLLILMSLLISSHSTPGTDPPTDALKVAAFECMFSLLHQIAQRDDSAQMLDEIGATSLLDQLVYQLLEEISVAVSESVQLGAAKALLEILTAVDNPVTLASLLPRTVSTLVKVLRPSTQARRTQKVLAAYLQLLTEILRRVLSDGVLSFAQKGLRNDKNVHSKPEAERVLDKSWLDATTPQIDIALTQVTKLRSLKTPVISEALLQLCLAVIEDCSESLQKSAPLMVETLIVLCRSDDPSSAIAALNHLVLSRPAIGEIINAKFFTWSQALPRVMQANDDRPKQQILGQLATSFGALAETMGASEDITARIASVLVDSVSASIKANSQQLTVLDGPAEFTLDELIHPTRLSLNEFQPLVLSHQSQQSSTKELNAFIRSLMSHSGNYRITRNIIEQLRDPSINRRLSATWLALKFLDSTAQPAFSLDDFVQEDETDEDWSLTRPFLVSDLYAQTLPHLLQYADEPAGSATDWRMVALALESLILQANQLGESYRAELMETLFPVLILFGSGNPKLQTHAMTALNLLAQACNYISATQMLIENVDYLINAIAMRLNSFDVSQAGLRVLAMMVRLCGPDLLPHLDDVISSIFSALDNYHGYPKLVEYLFTVLRLVVDESSKNPAKLAIEQKPILKNHEQRMPSASAIDDILLDLQTRKNRRDKVDEELEASIATPHRPWKSTVDNPNAMTTDEGSENGDHDGDSTPEEHPKKDERKVSGPHQLLIRIAEATIPHISSPSAKVRLTLLEMLGKICPVLAAEENTFLPLVNSIWPALTSRLLAQQDDESQETHYNIQAAVETIRIICENAGDFMASRIDERLSSFEALFRRLQVSKGNSESVQASIKVEESKPFLISPVSPDMVNHGREGSVQAADRGHHRRPEQQILQSLLALFCAILRSVRISEDNADRIFEILGPSVGKSGGTPVQAALTGYNSDFVWLMKIRQGE